MTVPLWLHRRPAQAVVSGMCSVLFSGLACLLLVSASQVREVTISYSHDDESKSFTLDQDLSGDVFLWYELPEMAVNRRDFVENKDAAIFGSFISQYTCSAALTASDVLWRREPDASFGRLLGGPASMPSNTAFRPCGLVSLAMFTDEYRLLDGSGEEVRLDETDLCLPGDSDLYREAVVPVVSPGDANGTSGGGPIYTVEGVVSWLRGGPFFEHLKVWYRTPASPHVRHLWAKVRGGLAAGSYQLMFAVNSPVWTTQWGVPEKRVIIAQSRTLGSSGACAVLGGLCGALGAFELLLSLSFVLLPGPRSKVVDAAMIL